MNIDNFCRTCAQYNATRRNWKKMGVVELNVLDYLLEWKLNDDDRMPPEVCNECKKMLIKIERFREKAIKAKEYLESLFQKTNHTDKLKIISEPVCKVETQSENEQELDQECDNSTDETLNTDDDTSMNAAPPEFEAIKVESEQMLTQNDKKYIAEENWEKEKEHDRIDIQSELEAERDKLSVPNQEQREESTLNSSEDIKNNKCRRRRQPHSTSERCKFCVCKISEQPHFPTKQALTEHIRQVHTDKERPYNCPHCIAKYGSKSGCLVHINTIHLKATLQCDICNKEIIGGTGKLRVHIERNHTKGDYKCDACGKEFRNTTLRNFNYHKRWHMEDKLLKCTHCDKSFVRSTHLRSHLVTHTKQGAFLCTHCGKSTRNKWELRAHLYSTHGEGAAPATCDYCDQKFARYAHKRIHMDRHHADKFAEYEIQCHICQRKFANDSNLQRHLKFPHKPKNAEKKPPPYKTFQCPLCPRKFRAEYVLTKHAEVHSMVGRPFPCDECDMSFKNASILKKHKDQKHSTERPFKCEKCSKAFALKSSLKMHIQIHESTIINEKKFQCSQCSRKYKFEKSLLLHQLTHSQMKHSCDKCGKSYIKPEQLISHINRYHKEIKKAA